MSFSASRSTPLPCTTPTGCAGRKYAVLSAITTPRNTRPPASAKAVFRSASPRSGRWQTLGPPCGCSAASCHCMHHPNYPKAKIWGRVCQAGDKAKARTELETPKQQGDRFAAQPSVTRLLVAMHRQPTSLFGAVLRRAWNSQAMLLFAVAHHRAMPMRCGSFSFEQR